MLSPQEGQLIVGQYLLLEDFFLVWNEEFCLTSTHGSWLHFFFFSSIHLFFSFDYKEVEILAFFLTSCFHIWTRKEDWVM